MSYNLRKGTKRSLEYEDNENNDTPMTAPSNITPGESAPPRIRPRITDPPVPRSTSAAQMTGTSAAPAGADEVTGSGGGLIYTSIYDYPAEGQLFTETRTANLKWEGYFSVHNCARALKAGAATSMANSFAITLNHPYQPLVATLNTGSVTKNRDVSGSIVSGLSAYPATQKFDQAGPHLQRTVGATTEYIYFPRQLVCETPTTAGDYRQTYIDGTVQLSRPTWLAWYEKLYEYYHVLESRYVIKIKHVGAFDSTRGNLALNSDAGVLIGVHPQSYVHNNISDIYPEEVQVPDNAGNIQTRSVTVDQAQNFKNLKWYSVDPPHADKGNITTITGNWKPGDITGSVKNVEDIKQWYATGAEPSPMWHEQHVFWLFCKGEVQELPAVDVHVFVEYKVQFKDLKQIVKFAPEPTHASQNVDLRIGIDNVQFPYSWNAHRTSIYDP